MAWQGYHETPGRKAERMVIYRRENREQIIAYNKARYVRLKDQIRKQHRTYLQSDTAKYLFRNAKNRAKKKNLPFSITLEDIIIPATCPVLGIPLVFEMGNRQRANYNNPSLDRHVPALGYVRGNVYVLSWRANTLKNNATLEEIALLLSYMEKMEGRIS